tara:strand:- start:164 stop:1276 length:1113 start_codon:yes stop_codon:yes gene_type:complete
MPPKDDDDPASTKEVVTKKQKQLLNREEMDLNLIAESLGGFVIEGRRRKKYRGRNQGSKPVQTTPQRTDPRDFMPDPGSTVPNPKVKTPTPGGPRVNPGPSPFDIDDVRPGDVGIEDDPRAASYADSDMKTDQRAGRSIRGRTPAPGTNQSLWKRFQNWAKSSSGSKVGPGQVLGTATNLVGLANLIPNLYKLNPSYDARKDPNNSLYRRPEPEYKPVPGVVYGQRANEIGALSKEPSSVPVKPPKLPKPRKLPVEPKPSPEPEPQVEPSQDPAQKPKTKPPVVTPKNPDGDKKKPPVTVNPPTGVGSNNKTGSNQSSTTLPQGQLAQIAQGTATAQALKSATSKTGKGKLPRIGVPGYRGKIGRRSNPQ